MSAESRWVVTGSRGQLGRALVESLSARPGATLLAAVDLDEVDISDETALRGWFEGLESPTVVMNAAAFTHVDRCEREPELAHRGNALAPQLLAERCAERGVPLIHVSTDYVFAGDGSRPYREIDAPNPRSVYGVTKLEGERSVLEASDQNLVVRTSWVFGAGRNFIAAILDQAQQRRRERDPAPLRVVDDQIGRPTYAVDLAESLQQLLERRARGLYHVANRGVASWWDLARLCLDEAGYSELSIERSRTAELKLDAPRPAWSVLDCTKAESLGVEMRSWQEAAQAYLESAASPLADAATELG